MKTWQQAVRFVMPRRQNYKDIDEVLNVVLGDSDKDIDLGEENSDYNDDSNWEYKVEHPQPTVTFVADSQPDDIMVDNDNNIKWNRCQNAKLIANGSKIYFTESVCQFV